MLLQSAHCISQVTNALVKMFILFLVKNNVKNNDGLRPQICIILTSPSVKVWPHRYVVDLECKKQNT